LAAGRTAACCIRGMMGWLGKAGLQQATVEDLSLEFSQTTPPSQAALDPETLAVALGLYLVFLLGQDLSYHLD
jgi:hypothetical protein